MKLKKIKKWKTMSCFSFIKMLEFIMLEFILNGTTFMENN